MATICAGVQGNHQPTTCPICNITDEKASKPKTKNRNLIFNAVGILIAVLATYMIISTDSKLYIVFWIFYSVLRRLMVKTNAMKSTCGGGKAACGATCTCGPTCACGDGKPSGDKPCCQGK
ncbi:unnamed protein product [Leptidea sinapis]|uniref:Uncharacterized protein n=1 Tax=Leptidea sinapis TaxID=189913 RepID=A0A5E4QWC7_9NEOP|nr:unnamed protein product [Leptidea sinapis]